MIVRFVMALVLLLVAVAPALAQVSPTDAVVQHFEAVEAEEYTRADSYFSAAFKRAFKGDVPTLNQYYTTRRAQLWRGYEIMGSQALDDEDHTTAMVIVEFMPPEDSPIHVTERLYYYLILERQSTVGPDTDSYGQAWRIDIFGAFQFDTLGEARRRPYLYTRESWPDPEGKELISRQGLFRLQWSLESFFFDNLDYPLRLLGSNNRRDELIGGGYLTGAYPRSGFNDRAMEVVHFGQKSSGDFSYISFDSTGDGELDGYWLLLHGKVKGNYYFEGRDTVYILGNVAASGQFEIAEIFSHFWKNQEGEELKLTAALHPLEPKGSTVPTLAQSGLGALVPSDQQHTNDTLLPGVETLIGEPTSHTNEIGSAGLLDDPGLPEKGWPLSAESLMKYLQRRSGSLLELDLPYEPPRSSVEPLIVYHYGFE